MYKNCLKWTSHLEFNFFFFFHISIGFHIEHSVLRGRYSAYVQLVDNGGRTACRESFFRFPEVS